MVKEGITRVLQREANRVQLTVCPPPSNIRSESKREALVFTTERQATKRGELMAKGRADRCKSLFIFLRIPSDSLGNLYAKCGDLLRAKLLFDDIQKTGMLSGGTASSMGTLNKARQDHRLSWNSFSECEQRTSCLIPIPSPAFSRCIELVGLKVFDEMPETNSVSWATMVSGYPIQRPAVEAEIFKLMRLKDEKVNEYALTDPELLNTGRQIHCLRVKKWVNSVCICWERSCYNVC
ncbi:hypothetical protein V6N11_042859 [Hibiscus sabdariffa]|uniref:Uncharacterized protein n=1 Tax=Hibiscus sabdariffa TaxID=183260 RepID=A0ABR2QXL5_9ROSI